MGPGAGRLGHLRDPSVGSRAVQLLELGELRTHNAGSFQASVWIRPRTTRGGWQPLPLEGEGTSGLRFQMLLGQDNGGPSGVCAGTHSPGRRYPHSLQWAGREWARGSCGGGADSPARWGRGSAPGMPRRGEWAGQPRPRPRAGSQWARRRRVTEGAEVRVPRRRRWTAQPEREGLGGARGSQCSGGDPGPGGGAARGRREERGRFGGGAMPLAQLKEPWPLMELVPLDPEVSERGGGRAPAAGQPGSAQGRGGLRRLCSPARTRVPSGL